MNNNLYPVLLISLGGLLIWSAIKNKAPWDLVQEAIGNAKPAAPGETKEGEKPFLDDDIGGGDFLPSRATPNGEPGVTLA